MDFCGTQGMRGVKRIIIEAGRVCDSPGSGELHWTQKTYPELGGLCALTGTKLSHTPTRGNAKSPTSLTTQTMLVEGSSLPCCPGLLCTL